MKRSWIWCLAVAVICLSAPAAVPCSGHESDAPQEFNVADLADGETRTFGQGDHAITATRKGEEVTLTLPGKKGEKTIRCTVGKDSCSVMAVDGKGENRLVVLTRTGQEGHDEETFIITAGADESGRVVIHGTGPDALITTTDVAGSGPGTKVIRIVAEGGTVLRCPEGDATLTLKKGEEKTGPYFCPRHNLKMEPSREPVVLKEMMIERKSGSQDEEH